MSATSFFRLQTVPTLPTAPPTTRMKSANLVRPCNLNERRPGRINAMPVPDAAPTRSRISPRFGETMAR